jgi:hypothetical protein
VDIEKPPAVNIESLSSMTDAIKAVATGHVRVRPDAGSVPPEPSLTQVVKDVASRQRKPPATREGRKGIVIYVDQEVAAAIRRLASELNTTVQNLGTTAFDLLLEKFGEPRAG